MKRPSTRKHTSAQAAVEFCLVLPLLILILVLIVNLGYFLRQCVSVHEAVREASLLAMYDDTAPAPAHVYTVQDIKDRIKATTCGETILDSEISVNRNDTITVASTTYRAFNIRVDHTHSLLVPFVFWSGLATLPISSSMKSVIVPGLTP